MASWGVDCRRIIWYHCNLNFIVCVCGGVVLFCFVFCIGLGVRFSRINGLFFLLGPDKKGHQFSCVCLHGDRKPHERKQNLERFKVLTFS